MLNVEHPLTVHHLSLLSDIAHILYFFQVRSLVRRFPDTRRMGTNWPTVLLLLVISMLTVNITFFVLFCPNFELSVHISMSYMLYSLWFMWSYSLSCLYSVPDLSEYRVWLGSSDIREGASDLSKRQEVSIAHVICGPDNSSLALLRLSKWVSGEKKVFFKGWFDVSISILCDVDDIFVLWCVCWTCADLPFLQTTSIRSSCPWLDAPSQREQFAKCMDGARPKVQHILPLLWLLFKYSLKG